MAIPIYHVPGYADGVIRTGHRLWLVNATMDAHEAPAIQGSS